MTDNFTNPEKDNAIFELVQKKSQEFLEGKEHTINKLKARVKECYDYTKGQEILKGVKSDALPELIIKNFDLEQIFQQIELQNEPLLGKSLTNVTRLIVGKDRLIFKNLEQTLAELEANHNQDPNEESDQEHMEVDQDHEEDSDNEEEIELNDRNSDNEESYNENVPGPSNTKQSNRQSVVDDDFFKLDEMEAFLNAEERKTNDPDSGNDSEDESGNESEESVDLFEPQQQNPDFEVDDKVITARYKDFFVAKDDELNIEKPEKRNKFLKAFDDDDDDNEEGPKSSYELRQERLADKIDEIEENAIGEKPWQLKGEISANCRPQNSLLEEIVEFDMTSRPAPVITEQTTLQLEDIIRQRIKNKVFDSVERKAKPVETPLEYKKKLVLNQEKSKESLAQIYEKEYLDQKDDQEGIEKPEEEPLLHTEITSMMTTLFQKLDSLSNFHFTPKPVAPEVKIISNLPAINMEEVAPVATSDATLLAPEEVKGKTKGDIVGESERSTTDKKRQRRKKKLKQKVHVKEKEKREMNKLKSGLATKYTKEKAKKMLDKVVKEKNVEKIDESSGSKSVKSSTAFFTQLQTNIKDKVAVKKRSKAKIQSDASKLKL